MFDSLIILSGILIIAILFTLFRVGTLVNVVRNRDKKPVTGSNKVNATLLALFVIGGLALFFYYSSAYYDEYTLPLASEHGIHTDRLFWWTMGVTVAAFVITHIVLIAFAYKYRYAETQKATFFPDNTKLEVIWTIIPAIVLATLIFSGLATWTDITGPAPDDAEVIEVYGFQFGWKSRYPGNDGELGGFDFRKIDAVNDMGIDFSDEAALDDFVPIEMHVPKGKAVELKIRAKDVIHSVFIPHFRAQMNAVPGMPTRFWFTATKTTEEMRAELDNPEFNYELVCNKICGKAHFAMRYVIVVDEPEDYEKWKAEQTAWLKNNPDYLSKLPSELKELAMLKSGISE
ncbi:MAG: cytochrome c oxidase subunit II [Bacteroidota bacterium]